ncbi:hypothetical protein [Psychrobacter sp. DM4]
MRPNDVCTKLTPFIGALVIGALGAPYLPYPIFSLLKFNNN